MAIFLFGLASFVGAIASFFIFLSAKSAIHEILGVALGLVSAIFGVGSVVTYHLDRLPDRIAHAMAAEQARRAPPPIELHVPLATPAEREREPDRERGLGWTLGLLVLVLSAMGAIYALYLHAK